MNIEVSVIMSIYNEPEHWLRQAIESILTQTFKDFEFLIVNDKPDNIVNRNVLKEYALLDSRIVIIENTENIGLTKSLNKSMKLARGKYIARMDADDIAIKNRLEIQYNYLENNSDILLTGSFMILIDEKNKEIGEVKYPQMYEELKKELILKNVLSHPTYFFKRDVFEKYQIFYDESFKYAQDYDFSSRVALVGGIRNLPNKLLKYRVSAFQIGKSKIKEQDMFANKIRNEYIVSLFKQKYNLELVRGLSLFSKLKSLESENPKDDFVKSALLCCAIYLNEANLLDKIKMIFSFKYSIKNSLRIIKSI